MSKRKPGLGRGLDALLGGMGEDVHMESGHAVSNDDGHSVDGELKRLPVDLIQRGRYQPRIEMDPDALEELANSIRVQGVVQPIVVRELETKPGHYEIVAGERRWRATQMAGIHDIPALIRTIPDNVAIAVALIENIQREQLNPMEEALALQRLIDEFELTHQDAAEAVGRSRVAVSNLLRLIALNEDVKRLLEGGEIEMGHARALLGLSGAQQSEAARIVVNKHLSVRDTEQLVRQMASQEGSTAASATTKKMDPNIARLQQDLSERLAAKVQVQHSAKGKGKLVINYNDLDELEGILEHIR